MWWWLLAKERVFGDARRAGAAEGAERTLETTLYEYVRQGRAGRQVMVEALL